MTRLRQINKSNFYVFEGTQRTQIQTQMMEITFIESLPINQIDTFQLQQIQEFMSFAQRLSKIQRKASQGSECRDVLQNQLLKINIKNGRKFTQFEKHHTELKSMLKQLECQKSASLYSTPTKKQKNENLHKSVNKSKTDFIQTKQNKGTKILFQNSPDKRLKLKINKFPQQLEMFELKNQSLLMKNLRCSKKQSKQSRNNPQNTPKLQKTLTNKSSISSVKQKKGIPNIGNTCYINAVLQCLFHLKDFSEGFVSQYTDKHQILNKYMSLFDGVMSKINQNPDLSTLPLKKSVSKICSLFMDFHQQDAHQFLKKLLDSIHQQINKVRTPGEYKVLQPNLSKKNLATLSQQYWSYYKKFDDSYIYDNLCGQICNYVTCANCKHESVGFDNFLDFSLPIIKGKNKLEDLIKQYFDVEALSDFYFCSSCKKYSKKSLKRGQLWKAPNFLIIQLKRSQFGKKNNEKIRIPVRCLNLKPYMNSNQKQSKPAMYYLQGVVLHRGIIQGGHYWAHVKDGLNWYSMDDEKSQKLNRDSLVNDYQEQGSEQAYILFYKSM